MAMRRWPRDQKSKPEVNSRDVIKWINIPTESISISRLGETCFDSNHPSNHFAPLSTEEVEQSDDVTDQGALRPTVVTDEKQDYTKPWKSTTGEWYIYTKRPCFDDLGGLKPTFLKL